MLLHTDQSHLIEIKGLLNMVECNLETLNIANREKA